MPQLTISQVARQIGLQASAIRYYEQIGILPPAQRVSGQRRYDATVLHRIAVIQKARQTGFTLDEVRQLFFGFRPRASASQRWRKLSRKKLAELEILSAEIKTMQELLRRLAQNCHCRTLDECGSAMLRNGFPKTRIKTLAATLNRRHSSR